MLGQRSDNNYTLDLPKKVKVMGAQVGWDNGVYALVPVKSVPGKGKWKLIDGVLTEVVK